MQEPPKGILLLHKPKEITSFTLVQQVRKRMHERKVGHAGTLDPLASGLMVVGVGEGTKLLKHYIGADKVYIAEICIGEKSTTGDAEGPIVEKKDASKVTRGNIEKVLTTIHGVLRLPVSLYSAMKRGGEPLYKKVRRGEQVTAPMRDMEVHKAVLLDTPKYKNGCCYCTIEFTVGSGTYVRSLGEELGKRLGYPARLNNLCRTQVGEFSLEQAIQIEQLNFRN